MYLTKKVYVKNWDHLKPEERHEITVKKNGVAYQTAQIRELVYEVAYWRKANAIHKWFVDTVQEGKDECQESYVEREQLEALFHLCQKVAHRAKLVDGEVNNGWQYTPEKGQVALTAPGKVIANAEEIATLLPTEEGFFFGSTDYDEHYLFDINRTIEMLEKALNDPLKGDFYYQASW
jgi:hypothetical protein